MAEKQRVSPIVGMNRECFGLKPSFCMNHMRDDPLESSFCAKMNSYKKSNGKSQFMSYSLFSPKDLLLQRTLLRVRPTVVASLLKQLFGIKRKMVSTAVGQFYVDPVSNFAKELGRSGQYKPEMLLCLQLYLSPSSVFIDVGANEGYFSIAAAKLIGASGKVISIEPQKRLKGTFKNLPYFFSDVIQ